MCKMWLMIYITYVVMHIPTHSLAHPPHTHGGHIPAALSSPPEQSPSSHQRCFSSSLFSFPSRPAPHRAKPVLPAGHHTPALALHPRRSLQLIVVIATGCSWPLVATFSPVTICHGPGAPVCRASGHAPTPPRGTDPCTAPSTLRESLRVHGVVNLDPVLPGTAV